MKKSLTQFTTTAFKKLGRTVRVQLYRGREMSLPDFSAFLEGLEDDFGSPPSSPSKQSAALAFHPRFSPEALAAQQEHGRVVRRRLEFAASKAAGQSASTACFEGSRYEALLREQAGSAGDGWRVLREGMLAKRATKSITRHSNPRWCVLADRLLVVCEQRSAGGKGSKVSSSPQRAEAAEGGGSSSPGDALGSEGGLLVKRVLPLGPGTTVTDLFGEAGVGSGPDASFRVDADDVAQQQSVVLAAPSAAAAEHWMRAISGAVRDLQAAATHGRGGGGRGWRHRIERGTAHAAAMDGDQALLGRLLARASAGEAKLDTAAAATALIASGGAGAAAVLANAVDPEGDTPLHLAAISGSQLLCAQLLGAGAEVSSVDGRLRTPLHLAAAFGHPAVVQLLLGRGARAAALDADERTPLALAAVCGERVARGAAACVELLAALPSGQGGRGRWLDARDSHGETPLHAVAAAGHPVMAAVLLEVNELSCVRAHF